MNTGTPWGRRVREILADGNWHTLDELVDAAGPLIPPGQAARVHSAHSIESGRRRLIRTIVSKMARAGGVERRGGPGRLEYRAR